MTVIGPFFGSHPNQLQKDGTISFSRGVIKILDRSMLEALSSECYQSLIDQSATLGRYSAPTGAPPNGGSRAIVGGRMTQVRPV